MIALAALVALATIVCLSEAPADGASVSERMNVVANVRNNCQVRTTADLAFGTYSGVVTDAVGEIRIRCNRRINVFVRVSQGSSAAPGSTEAAPLRRMASGGSRLPYNIFTDAARTTVWNNTTGLLVQDNRNVENPVPLYGRIPRDQNVPVGTYTDIVVVSMDY